MITINNMRERNEALKAIAEFDAQPKKFEVNKFYRWNFPAWCRGANPTCQGGRLQCVYTDTKQSVLRNQHGLHLVANNHLVNGDIILTD